MGVNLFTYAVSSAAMTETGARLGRLAGPTPARACWR